MSSYVCSVYFFFNDTATTEIYTLSLHDALPICIRTIPRLVRWIITFCVCGNSSSPDRKSTRLNSSHQAISYAVFCLKKKNNAPLEVWRHGTGDRPRRGHGLGGLARVNLAIGDHRRVPNSTFLYPDGFFFFLMIRGPPRFTSFPQPPPFRI